MALLVIILLLAITKKHFMRVKKYTDLETYCNPTPESRASY